MGSTSDAKAKAGEKSFLGKMAAEFPAMEGDTLTAQTARPSKPAMPQSAF